MTEELIEWGRVFICTWTLSLTWICRIVCGIPIHRTGMPTYPPTVEISLWIGCCVLTKAF